MARILDEEPLMSGSSLKWLLAFALPFLMFIIVATLGAVFNFNVELPNPDWLGNTIHFVYSFSPSYLALMVLSPSKNEKIRSAVRFSALLLMLVPLYMLFVVVVGCKFFGGCF